MKHILIYLIRFYQLALSPTLAGLAGARHICRFYPSCSQYAVEAVARYGASGGAKAAARRVLRCRPGNIGGYDPA